MNIDELDYELPGELIAQHPAEGRSGSRLMVLDRKTGELCHQHFSDVVEYLKSGDVLVVNDSRVIPARFFIRRQTGGKMEGLFLQESEAGHWQVLLKNAGRLKEQEEVCLFRPEADTDETERVDPVFLRVEKNQGQGQWQLGCDCERTVLEILHEYGYPPLPPYIHRQYDQPDHHDRDRDRYQTVYADGPGSVAAPTAGLHFTQELLEQLENKGVILARLTLHVGRGTFLPITTDPLQDHPMHAEYYDLSEFAAERINRVKKNGGRVIAVGTTCVRTLESTAQKGQILPGRGWTKLFILPGYPFEIIDGMITNFHLPRSTLLALVCAFAGKERTLEAYRQAVQKRYRFYSYGDAMLIL